MRNKSLAVLRCSCGDDVKVLRGTLIGRGPRGAGSTSLGGVYPGSCVVQRGRAQPERAWDKFPGRPLRKRRKIQVRPSVTIITSTWLGVYFLIMM